MHETAADSGVLPDLDAVGARVEDGTVVVVVNDVDVNADGARLRTYAAVLRLDRQHVVFSLQLRTSQCTNNAGQECVHGGQAFHAAAAAEV